MNGIQNLKINHKFKQTIKKKEEKEKKHKHDAIVVCKRTFFQDRPEFREIQKIFTNS